MNAVLNLDNVKFNTAQAVMYSVRRQITCFAELGLVPAVISMTQYDYASLESLVGTQFCYNSDKHTISGIPVVICEISSKPTLYTDELLTTEDFNGRQSNKHKL